MSFPAENKRIIVNDLNPELDCGRFPIKRVVGESVAVRARVFADGHDYVGASLLYRRTSESEWRETLMRPIGNDSWSGSFVVDEVGKYLYTVKGWIDTFKTWQSDLEKRVDAGQEVSLELLIGAGYVEAAAKRAAGPDSARLLKLAADIKERKEPDRAVGRALSQELSELMAAHGDRDRMSNRGKELVVVVDRKRALFGSWYEAFPRSCAGEGEGRGDFPGCMDRLPEIARMGFDVLYLPPIHPIGRTNRKGKNNSPAAGPDDPGSPWAIGSEEGGHKAIHPELGTMEDFHRLAARARELGMEVALDLAFQCSPDHPYIKEHPEWFKWRPDGTLQYAENPPKKYEDIYPFDFETDRWRELWEELKSVVVFWIEQGVKIFRVDNPHTKPLPFWEWLIGGIKEAHPEVIFLAEAFTRPTIMRRLAKLGFTQSYTYFAWRNTQKELRDYFEELTQSEAKEYFRPNLWPNTPDILTEYLQMGGRAAFMTRLILAATLGASYGIYGPAFELMENRPKEFGSEEYLNSEKYEIKRWEVSRPDSLSGLIAQVNRIRRDNPALQGNSNLTFIPSGNEQLLCYGKYDDQSANVVLVVVNLDPYHAHAGWLEIPLEDFGLDPDQSYQVHDLLSDVRYLWFGPRNYVQVDPNVIPAHIFRIRRRIRTERDFDYFM